MLLSWMGFKYKEDKLVNASNLIEKSANDVIAEKKFITTDIGGKSSTQDMGEEIIRKLECNSI